MMRVALRVDVDTAVGLKEGVPRLLELLRRYGLRASFFVSLGPDRSGRAIRRLLRPSFLLKMARTNPFRLYGLRTLLSGTLLPSRLIGEEAPDLLRAVVAEGHELGIHGYDHVLWQDRIEAMGEREIAAELSRAVATYEKLLGTRPASSAAPGWRCTAASLGAQDRLGFLYASDVRGFSPFLPVENGRVFKTLQVPVTLPTVDELLGRKRRINDAILSRLGDGLNVHAIHAEVEGRSCLCLFGDLLKEFLRRGIELVTLREVAEGILKNGLGTVSHLPLTCGKIPGRSGWVACQGGKE